MRAAEGCLIVLHTTPHIISIPRTEKWDAGYQVYEGVCKTEQGERKEGSRSSNTVGTVSHQKTGSGRNVTETAKDGNERKEAPKPTRIPP